MTSSKARIDKQLSPIRRAYLARRICFELPPLSASNDGASPGAIKRFCCSGDARNMTMRGPAAMTPPSTSIAGPTMQPSRRSDRACGAQSAASSGLPPFRTGANKAMCRGGVESTPPIRPPDHAATLGPTHRKTHQRPPYESGEASAANRAPRKGRHVRVQNSPPHHLRPLWSPAEVGGPSPPPAMAAISASVSSTRPPTAGNITSRFEMAEIASFMMVAPL